MSYFDIHPFKDRNSERYMLSKRIGRLLDALEDDYLYTDSEEVSGFYIRDGQYAAYQKTEGEWLPFNSETDRWGYRECYCWFKHSFNIPMRFKDKTVLYKIIPHDEGSRGTDPQFIMFANGKCIQGMDPNHTTVKLADRARGTEHFDVYLNAYTDDHSYRGKVGLRAKLITVDEDVQKLLYHMRIPLDVANIYGVDDEPRINIIKTLNEAVNMVKLNLPCGKEFRDSVLAATAYLEKNLYGRGNKEIVVSAIGHTHIDVAWLWRLRQTREKTGRTFATVLKMMEENPDYKFISSQAQLYDYVKQDYPEVYEGIKQRVREGRWEIEGGMWVEADMNLASGEALVRQFLVGKRFFRREFDRDCKILWLPDVFGYTAALPQIMKKCGIDYFMTTKISWNEYTRVPYDTFIWRGIDGSEVLSHFIPTQSVEGYKEDRTFTTYNGYLDPDSVIGGWGRYQQKDLNKNILNSFGYGDGGGGPTQDMLEQGKRMEMGIEGCPRVKFEFAREFFDRLAKEVSGNKYLNTWCGELYLEFHRGTLTAQARNKRYNRKSEVMYQDIENLSVLCAVLKDGGFDRYPKTGLDKGWEIILLNQFHDIIPGSSIKQVYEDSKEQYDIILNEGGYMMSNALDRVASSVKTEGKAIVVFNTLSFKRGEAVICDKPVESDFSIVDSFGLDVQYQETYDGKIVFFAADIPAKGYRSFFVRPSVSAERHTTASINGNNVASRFYNIDFNDKMEMMKVVHRKSGRAIAPEGTPVNRLIAYEDRPFNNEAWNVQAYFTEKEWPIDDVINARVVENGPVRAVLMVVRKFQNSLFTQNIILYNDIDRIDVTNTVDWKESYFIVKADFPVDVNAVKATYDIQFGNIERTAHNNTTADFAQFEVCGHKWADISDNSFGLSVLNDCKYGYDIKDNRLRLSLIRCQNSPQPQQDQEMHYFTYSLYPHDGPVTQSDVVKHGYSINYPLYASFTDGQGNLDPEYSLMSLSKDNIIAETIKKAEDSDDIVIRLYETWNAKTACSLKFGRQLRSASECDMMEENDAPLAVHDNILDLNFKPFEIKTLKIKF